MARRTSLALNVADIGSVNKPLCRRILHMGSTVRRVARVNTIWRTDSVIGLFALCLRWLCRSASVDWGGASWSFCIPSLAAFRVMVVVNHKELETMR